MYQLALPLTRITHYNVNSYYLETKIMGKIKQAKKMTYISLFSGAGIGCYGFMLEGFECIATAELLERRLSVQKGNNKCKYETGYISEDLTSEVAKKRIFDEILRWKRLENINGVDVIIATPPCQGMSVANHKKKDELARNSLVVESIKLTKEINPRVFVFENVRAFLGTTCTDVDGKDKTIKEAIEVNLGGGYNIHYQVINFKDYGSSSSRTRTLVIGTRKDIIEVNPVSLIPDLKQPKTLRELIGDLPRLKMMGEIYPGDIYHQFRPYAEHMLSWIKDIKEGQSAFDNVDPKKRPHTVVNGKVIFNTNKNGDKYTRCYWNKVAPCVHTRNDILASQATIHPVDDRVFSIRELMRMMTVPDGFKWSNVSERNLNSVSLESKRQYLAKEEMNIRQSLGEAVPTIIFQQIAQKIKQKLLNHKIDISDAKRIVDQHGLFEVGKLQEFLKVNLQKYSYPELSKIAELANAKRLDHAAYYTRQDIAYTLAKDLPDEKYFSELRILEPSVGAGNFLPVLVDKYKSVPRVDIDVVDIDPNSLATLKILLKSIVIPKNVNIKFINDDFLLHNFVGKYDIVIGNPPFGKVDNNKELLAKYREDKYNKTTSNLASFFIEKSLKLGSWVAMILPKSVLSAPEFNKTRELICNHRLVKICDYGEQGFKGVKIETISLVIDGLKRDKELDNDVKVESYIINNITVAKQNYICSTEYPYWLIYRDSLFDQVAKKLRFGLFDAYRDRQITKKFTKSKGKVRVLKSRNITNKGVVDIKGYDTYVDDIKAISISRFMNEQKAILVPNLSYYPRAIFLPNDAIVDGSIAILIPKNKKENITKNHLKYFSSDEFTQFYRVARNYGTRSLNIDSNSVFFWGIPR